MSNCGGTGGHIIVAGYGLPGRVLVDALVTRQVEHCIIELNPATVTRCEKSGTSIIAGDSTDPEILHQAGIETAAAIAILIPDEHAALETTSQARRLNPSIRIITRCHYTSTGIEARAPERTIVSR